MGVSPQALTMQQAWLAFFMGKEILCRPSKLEPSVVGILTILLQHGGGLLGFMIGKDGIEEAYGMKFSNKFNIHRTRQNFPNGGIDTFEDMAEKGLIIIDRVVMEEMGGGLDRKKNVWYIPQKEPGVKL